MSQLLSGDAGRDNGDEPRLVRAKPGAVADIPLPPCPYSEEDNIEEGLQCYIPGCAFKFTVWGSGLTHIKNYHAAKLSWLNGEYIHTKGKVDMCQQQQKRRETPSEQHASNKRGKSTEEVNDEEFQWVVMPCFVKCDAQGLPAVPFQCGGLADNDEAWSGFRGVQTELVRHYGFPPKGDALMMTPPSTHVDTTRQTPVSVAGSANDHLRERRLVL